MTITLEITDSREREIRAAASRRGQDTETFLLSILHEEILFGDMEAITWDDPKEHAAALAGIRRGLADFAEGRYKPADQVFAEMKAKYGIPD